MAHAGVIKIGISWPIPYASAPISSFVCRSSSAAIKNNIFRQRVAFLPLIKTWSDSRKTFLWFWVFGASESWFESFYSCSIKFLSEIVKLLSFHCCFEFWDFWFRWKLLRLGEAVEWAWNNLKKIKLTWCEFTSDNLNKIPEIVFFGKL